MSSSVTEPSSVRASCRGFFGEMSSPPGTLGKRGSTIAFRVVRKEREPFEIQDVVIVAAVPSERRWPSFEDPASPIISASESSSSIWA